MNDSLISQDTEDQGASASALDSTEATSEGSIPPPTDRPEWLPEKYSSPEELAKAYKALESKLGTKEEDLRKSILDELQQEAYGDRPESAGDYQLPENVDPESAVDSELMRWWSEHAFENGYSQEEFQQGIEMYLQAVEGQMPDLEAEAARLGDNASARVEAASMFASKFFPSEVMPAIERMCESAEGIMALEIIMENMKDGSFSGNTSSSSQITEASLQEMMQDDRYHNPARRDPHFIKQVEEGFRKLYG
jgi:hypothetical protein